MERQAVVDADVARLQLDGDDLAVGHRVRVVADLERLERAQLAAHAGEMAAVDHAQASGLDRALGQRQPHRDAFGDETGVGVILVPFDPRFAPGRLDQRGVLQELHAIAAEQPRDAPAEVRVANLLRQ